MKELLLLREKIDNVDEKIMSLFNERMEIIKDVSFYKFHNDLPIEALAREKELISKNKNLVKKEFFKYYEQFYKKILKISKDYQKELIDERKLYENK